MSDILNTAQTLLDEVRNALQVGNVMLTGALLGPALTRLHTSAALVGESALLAQTVANHDIAKLCMSVPYTKRAYDKPRGYAGDAVMLDYIYRGNTGQLDGIGRIVNQVTAGGPMGLSVAYRRSLLRSYLDQVATTVENARVLSVASGHCRELDDCLLAKVGGKPEFVALDQDTESCQEVARSYGADWLTVHNESIKQLLRSSFDIGKFDFIYSAGLYDYLPTAVASSLTARLVDRLQPGGILLLANFMPSASGRGYMELLMNWQLIWRTAQELREVFPATCWPAVATHIDPHDNVIYAVWKKLPT